MIINRRSAPIPIPHPHPAASALIAALERTGVATRMSGWTEDGVLYVDLRDAPSSRVTARPIPSGWGLAYADGRACRQFAAGDSALDLSMSMDDETIRADVRANIDERAPAEALDVAVALERARRWKELSAGPRRLMHRGEVAPEAIEILLRWLAR